MKQTELKPCDMCNAPKEIKDSVGCNCDQLYNAFEDFKKDLSRAFSIVYVPQYQCRFADLIDNIQEDANNEQRKAD